MDTVLSSPTKEVLIGPDHPFVIIGERINPTGRSKLAAEMASGNFERRDCGCPGAGAGRRASTGRQRRHSDGG